MRMNIVFSNDLDNRKNLIEWLITGLEAAGYSDTGSVVGTAYGPGYISILCETGADCYTEYRIKEEHWDSESPPVHTRLLEPGGYTIDEDGCVVVEIPD